MPYYQTRPRVFEEFFAGWTTSHSTLLLSFVVVLLLGQAPSIAAVITVGGECGLVDAIRSANLDAQVGMCVAGNGADRVVLTGDVVLTEVDNNEEGGNGTPSITSEIEIVGAGFEVRRVDVGNYFRLFRVAASGTLTLTDLVVAGGEFFYPPFNGDGGGILNRGRLTLVNSSVTESHAHYYGMGIFSSGTLAAVESSISDNISGNYSETGGLHNTGTAILVDTVVAGNGAETASGGITNTGSLTLINSTISGNRSDEAGALSNRGGVATILNSTISGNTGYYEAGGVSATSGFVSVRNSTITANEAGYYQGAGVDGRVETLSLSNTIVANNDRFNCRRFLDGGGNFSDDGSCQGASPIVAGIDFDTELTDNGGPTETHALLPGSVAIDAAGDCRLNTDQRGFGRTGDCDAGSHEFAGVAPGAPGIGVAGSCPGQVLVFVTGATPNGSILVIGASEVGTAILDSGVCAGTVVQLANPRVVRSLQADAAGAAAVSIDVAPGVCGARVAAVDVGTCAPSGVAVVPLARPSG